jgi:hypothetical protein
MCIMLKPRKINRLEELTKPEAERNLPPFPPPKPTLASGLTTMLNVLRTNLTSAQYKAGMVYTHCHCSC